MTEKLYFNKEQLQAELKRCLNCKNRPCMNACPVNCFSKAFIDFAKQEDYDAAARDIVLNNPFSEICGLVCPDKFCMKACIRGKIDNPIQIPKVQASVMEKASGSHIGEENVPYNGRHIAIVGGGPAGLSAAYFLSKKGYKITIFEAKGILGGAMNLIPQVRLPRQVVQKEFNIILNNQNIHIATNHPIENPESLLQDFDSVIVAKGMPDTTPLTAPGAEHTVSYLDYLKYPENYANYKNVAIIGGGLVAFDCAVIAHELKADAIHMFVRRDRTDMKISKKETEELVEMNVNVVDHTQIAKLEKQENNLLLTTKISETGEENAFNYPVDLLVVAIGNIAVEQPVVENVHYIGECSDGSLTVIEAIAAGKNIAGLF